MAELEDKPELREDIAHYLGELAEGMIRRVPPLDQVPFYEQLNSWISFKCYQYGKELPEALRAEIINAQVGTAKYMISQAVLPSKNLPPINISHPEYKEVTQKLVDWVRNREGRSVILPLRDMEKYNKGECIRDILGKRLPDFEYARKYASDGTLAFVTDVDAKHKTILFVDKGALPYALDFLVGLDDPRFFISISEFYAGAQANFEYYTKAELIDALNVACDFLKKFIPFFNEYILIALNKEK